MARRAKSSLSPVHIVIIMVVVAAFIWGGYTLMHRTSGSSFTGTSALSVREYLENSNSLSGNTYQIEGIVEERLDNWRSAEGRLFSVLVDDGADASPLPVLVPQKLNSTNIQRGQRFKFKVNVQAETGILEVMELTKA
ncbi:MAG: hypothetical protein ACAI34_04370 [Verrucomicrobium sp.]